MDFLRQFLGIGQMSSNGNAPMMQRKPENPFDPVEGKPSRWISIGAAQSIGMQRKENQDALFMLKWSAECIEGLQDFGLFCVADGLGGYEHGNVASSISIRSSARFLMQALIPKLLDRRRSQNDLPNEDLMRLAFHEASRAVGGCIRWRRSHHADCRLAAGR